MIFKARQFKFIFPRPALIVGILNVTPDSFYDGGQNFDLEAAVARGLEMERQGTEIIDVGGESTRPGAQIVSESEELRRVIPVIESLVGKLQIPISIDTRKPRVAEAALKAGVSIVNDIEANRSDPEMWKIVAQAKAGYVCMHMQGTPQTMQINPSYIDVVAEVKEFFLGRIKMLNLYGISSEQIILDPGIGFGKTLDHNLQLLRNLQGLTELGNPVLLGVSRKSFITKLLGVDMDERLPASLACAVWGVERGVNIVRAHDVVETVQAVRMAEALFSTSMMSRPSGSEM